MSARIPVIQKFKSSKLVQGFVNQPNDLSRSLSLADLVASISVWVDLPNWGKSNNWMMFAKVNVQGVSSQVSDKEAAPNSCCREPLVDFFKIRRHS